ncbi:MAG: cytochrome c5 [Gammaproteobacteria bacterium]|jgi:cytochrome c5
MFSYLRAQNTPLPTSTLCGHFSARRNSVKLSVFIFFLTFFCGFEAAAAGTTGYYGYGQPASAAEIAGWDIDVRPDGKGLPDGRGSVDEGENIYEEKCAECHGSFGEGVGRFPILAGGQDTLRDTRPSKTVGSFWAHTSTLWDYVHRSMPFTEPQSMSDNEVYAVVAYVLYLNDIVEDDFELTQSNLASIELPNRANFVPDPRPDVQNTRCMHKCKDKSDMAIVSSTAPLENVTVMAAQEIEAFVSAGETVYNQNCAVCHKSGVGGAPILGDRADWKSRLSVGMLTLKQHAIRGFQGSTGVMPAKGGFVNLSDEQVNKAVEFMVESGQ